jgi:hypothetical protein
MNVAPLTWFTRVGTPTPGAERTLLAAQFGPTSMARQANGSPVGVRGGGMSITRRKGHDQGAA